MVNVTIDSLREESVLSILRSSGRSRSVGDFSILDYFYSSTNEHPFEKNFRDLRLKLDFLDDLEKISTKKLFQRSSFIENSFKFQIDSVFFEISKGYVGEVEITSSSHDYLPELLVNTETGSSDPLILFSLFTPPDSSPLKDLKLEENIVNLVKKHIATKNTTDACIGMICVEDGEYYIKNFYIREDYTIKNPNLHYGKGFQDFHEKLLHRFSTEKKGLVLFHGTPGTGKTFYIRSLMKDLLKAGKYIIYLPPGMMESMIDPTMINFLSGVAMEKQEEKKSCILLIEDAEPLLVSRKRENRSAGITNLLNVTDGLLNDMLSVQVIATFNTELSNIDDALLRPERLIARKEFKKLKAEDANILLESLGMEKKATSEMTLAEIYASRKKNDILIHEYKPENSKIGFSR